MSHNINGHNNKAERLNRSAHIYDRFQTEEVNEVLFFAKGNLRGVLTVKDTTMEWNVYEDANFSKQLDWNAPECYPQYAVRRFDGGVLGFVSQLIEDGWKTTN